MSNYLDFKSRLSSLDFCDVLYLVLPKQGLRSKLTGTRVSSPKMVEFINQLPFHYSSDTARNFYQEVRRRVLHQPKLLPNCIWDGHRSHSGVVNNIDGRSLKGYQVLAEVWDSTEANSFSYYFTDAPGEQFFGVFFMLSQLGQSQLDRALSASWIPNYLDMVHFYFTRNYPRETNPNLFNGSIQEKTLKIIQMTSRGKNIREISEALHLTERGVAYHIDKAKFLLNASNKVELIRVAKENCML